MKPPKCRFCDKEEWRHVCAGATNRATNQKKDATNSERQIALVETPRPTILAVDRKAVAAPKTQNRRSREDYNAYQREYMRLKRAKAHA